MSKNRSLWSRVGVLAALSAAALPGADRLVFIGVWDRAQPMITTSAQQAGLEALYVKPADLLHDEKLRGQADSSRVVFVLNIEPADGAPLAEWAKQASAHGVKVVALDKRGSHFELEKAGVLVTDEQVARYWRANGSLNITRLIGYVQAKYFGRKVAVLPPIAIPDQGYYDPDHEEAFDSFAAYRTFRQARGRWKEGAPVAALLIQQSFWITHDVKVIDAQVRALERRGINPVVIFGDRQPNLEALVRETRPDLLIEDRHGAMWDNRTVLEQMDVPYLRPISMLGYTLDEWRKDPRGLSFRDVGMFMTLQESWGTIEPVLVGGMKVNISGFRLHEPLPDGVERFAGRTAAWLKLRRKPNAEKRVAIIYYNKGLGKDDLMRGSPTGAFLDGPESLVRFLPEMKNRKYTIDRVPRNAAELVSWAQKSGRLIGPWNRGELDDFTRTGDPVLIPVARYRHWFDTKLSPENRRKVIERFGPPPGRIMTVTRDGVPYIVIPRIRISNNVILAPQPERGEAQDDKLLHSRDIPPPHNYLAFYWWLQEEFRADAIMHWGTHGSLELLPGKEAGMSRDDWSDICVGDTPVVNLWIMDNLAEATQSRRRSYAHLVDHMVPPAVQSAMPDELENLRRDIEKYGTLEPGLLKQEYRNRIVAAIHEQKLSPSSELSEDDIASVSAHLNELYENRTPLTLHVLGEPPRAQDLYPYLVSISGKKFAEDLKSGARVEGPGAAAKWLENAINAGDNYRAETPALSKHLEFARKMRERLLDTHKEIDGLLRSLEGRYIQPGPGPEPLHNPDSVPGGRNLYALNPEEVPTRPAWNVAVQLVDQMLAKKRPRKVAFDLNGMNTMRDFGVLEAQILYMMGVRPVWDQNNLAIDVELIPRAELKHPRTDVFVAMGGMYKENFGTRVRLIDKAVRLVSQVEEPDNGVRQGTLDVRKRLLAKGMAPKEAEDLANARIFGTKPGNMSGTHILYLIPRSGVWDKSDEVAGVYIDNMSYAYTGNVWGEKIQGLYEESLQGTDTLVRVWSSNMTSQLSNHHAYEYLGGLSMAVKQVTGKEPEAFIADVRSTDGARMRKFEEVLDANLRSELLNREWIQGMKEHGYAGAGHAAELVKNTFGWTVTRPDSTGQNTWDQIYDVYVRDKHGLGVRQWMEQVNPHAMQEIAATMLEANRKGYWQPSDQTVAELSRLYAESVAKHGDSGGLVSGGNKHLEKYVVQSLNAPGAAPSGSALAARMSAALHRAQTAVVKPAVFARAAPGRPIARLASVQAPGLITGNRLRRVAQSIAPVRISRAAAAGSLFTVFALLIAGFSRRFGVIS